MHNPSLMAADHLQTGAAAESAALQLLQAAGLQLLARNVRYRCGELDLVMRQPGASQPTTVFVEVRQRQHASHGGALASIDLRKQRKLIAAAQLYLAQHPALANAPCRFDVVLFAAAPAPPQWLRDAFTADGH